MGQTLKLYESAPTVQEFTAVVLACTPAQDGWEVELDQTAFYPEGGGQPCDTGTLGGAAVSETRIHEGTILHRTSAPLEPGRTVTGRIDWGRRLDHMEQHTGEHILSGTLHRMFGAENVGFHIGQPAVRMDMSLPLTAEQLAQAEAAANAAVRADRPVRCWYPDEEELAALPYRSKKALEGPVRLVDAGGADLCACCGTHLDSTGQVGLIKILSSQSYKGGVRLAVVCGQRAYEAVAAAWQDAGQAGALLSAGPGRLTPAVTAMQQGEAALHQRLAALQNTLGETLAAKAVPGKPFAALCPGADGDGLRRLCLAVSQRSGALTAIFAPGGAGLSYALTVPDADARPLCRALNDAFGGRGGGKPGFCQGSLSTSDFDAVRAFLLRYSNQNEK